MDKCFFCDEDAKRTISVEHSHLVAGSQHKEPIKVCERHNKECWEKIDKVEFSATMLALLLFLFCCVGAVVFVFNIIKMIL